MSLDLNSRLRVLPEVTFQIVGSEAVLLDMTSEQYFGLNEEGTRILQLLKEGYNLSDIWSRLQDEYDAEPEILRRDLLELVQSLMDAGLVALANGEAGNAA